jgi:hypothetical protein
METYLVRQLVEEAPAAYRDITEARTSYATT